LSVAADLGLKANGVRVSSTAFNTHWCSLLIGDKAPDMFPNFSQSSDRKKVIAAIKGYELGVGNLGNDAHRSFVIRRKIASRVSA
jgi:hypothetical protein